MFILLVYLAPVSIRLFPLAYNILYIIVCPSLRSKIKYCLCILINIIIKNFLILEYSVDITKYLFLSQLLSIGIMRFFDNSDRRFPY